MTRAADRIGSGSFGTLNRPRSERGRAKAVAEGAIPTYELVRLELTAVSPAPANPRRDFGSGEAQEAFGRSLAAKQTTACVAVTREAYLKLWPAQAERIGSAAQHVILNGERRYRAALRVGLEFLDFVVRDDLATSRADFLDYLLLENEEREDFNVIERARGLKDLLLACDNNAAEVARRRGHDRSWVGNQIALLSLPDEIQHRLISGDMAERYGRRLARALKDDDSLTVDDLLALESNLKAEEKTKRATERALLEVAKNQMLSADNTTPAQPRAEAVLSADNISHPEAPKPVEDEDRATPTPALVLSADNTDAGEAPPRPGPVTSVAADIVLSADNTTLAAGTAPAVPLPHQNTPEVDAGRPAHDVVRALGATPAEQAATLRRGLDDTAFTALLEALYEHA